MIKFKDYTIKPNGFGRYDLFKTVVRTKTQTEEQKENKEPEEKYESEDNLAYAIPFESALKYLLTLCADDDDKVSVNGYLEAYRDNLRQVSELIKNNKTL